MSGEERRQRLCAECGKPQVQAYRPFCSKRCADVDLHRWLVGGYAIPGDRDEEAPGASDRDEGKNY